MTETSSPTAEYPPGLDHPTVRVYRPKPVAQFLRRLPVDARHEAVNYLTMLGLDRFASSGLFNHDAWQSLQVHSERALTNLRLLSKDVEPHLSAHFRSIAGDRHRDPLDDEETLNVDPLESPARNHRNRHSPIVGVTATSPNDGNNVINNKTESRMISPNRRPSPITTSSLHNNNNNNTNSNILRQHSQKQLMTVAAVSDYRNAIQAAASSSRRNYDNNNNDQRQQQEEKSISPSRKRYISPPLYRQDAHPPPTGRKQVSPHSEHNHRSQSVEFSLRGDDENQNFTNAMTSRNPPFMALRNYNNNAHKQRKLQQQSAIASYYNPNDSSIHVQPHQRRSASASARINTYKSDPRMIIIENDGTKVRPRPSCGDRYYGGKRVAANPNFFNNRNHDDESSKKLMEQRRQRRNLNESDVVVNNRKREVDQEQQPPTSVTEIRAGEKVENDDENTNNNAKGGLSTFVSMGYKDSKNHSTLVAAAKKKHQQRKKLLLQHQQQQSQQQHQYNTINLPGHQYQNATFSSSARRSRSPRRDPSFLQKGYDDDEVSPHGLRSASIRGMAAKLRSEAEALINVAAKMENRNSKIASSKSRRTASFSNGSNKRPSSHSSLNTNDDRSVVKSPSRRHNDVPLKSFIDTQRQRIQSQREIRSDVDETIVKAPAKKPAYLLKKQQNEQQEQQQQQQEQQQQQKDDEARRNSENSTSKTDNVIGIESQQSQTSLFSNNTDANPPAARDTTGAGLSYQRSTSSYHSNESGGFVNNNTNTNTNSNGTVQGLENVASITSEFDSKRMSPSRRSSSKTNEDQQQPVSDVNTDQENNINNNSMAASLDASHRGFNSSTPRLTRARKVALQLDTGEPVAIGDVGTHNGGIKDEDDEEEDDFQNAVPIRTSPTPRESKIKNSSFVSEQNTGSITSGQNIRAHSASHQQRYQHHHLSSSPSHQQSMYISPSRKSTALDMIFDTTLGPLQPPLSHHYSATSAASGGGGAGGIGQSSSMNGALYMFSNNNNNIGGHHHHHSFQYNNSLSLGLSPSDNNIPAHSSSSVFNQTGSINYNNNRRGSTASLHNNNIRISPQNNLRSSVSNVSATSPQRHSSSGILASSTIQPSSSGEISNSNYNNNNNLSSNHHRHSVGAGTAIGTSSSFNNTTNSSNQQQQHQMMMATNGSSDRTISPMRRDLISQQQQQQGNWRKHSSDLSINQMPQRFPKTPPSAEGDRSGLNFDDI